MAQMPNDVISEIYHDGYMAGYDEGRKAAIKHGKWVETDMGLYDEDVAWVCSICNEPWILVEGTPWQNGMCYCPNCGAKMDGDEE